MNRPDTPSRPRGGFASHAGFTLIELLVVIAIIGILVAILLPVLGRSKTRVKQAKCLNNQKQLGYAINMYTDEHDQRLPFGYWYTGPGQRHLYWWQDQCRPYISDMSVYLCPGRYEHIKYRYRRPPGLPNPLIRDYIANAQSGARSGGRPQWVGAGGPFNTGWGTSRLSNPLVLVEEPASTISFFDGFRSFEVWRLEQTDAWSNAGYGTAFVGNSPRGNPDTGHVHKRHNEKFNAAFVDGHSEPIKDSKLGQWTNRSGD